MPKKKRSVRIFGSNLDEDALKGPLKDVARKRRLKAILIVEDEGSEEGPIRDNGGNGGDGGDTGDGPDAGYANVYKYAFF